MERDEFHRIALGSSVNGPRHPTQPKCSTLQGNPCAAYQAITASCSSWGRASAMWCSEDRAPVSGAWGPVGCRPGRAVAALSNSARISHVPAEARCDAEERDPRGGTPLHPVEAEDGLVELRHPGHVVATDRDLARGADMEGRSGLLGGQGGSPGATRGHRAPVGWVAKGP